MAAVLVRRGEITETCRERKKGHVKTKTESGVMQLQVKECQKPPGVGSGKEGCFPTALGGSRALITSFK